MVMIDLIDSTSARGLVFTFGSNEKGQLGQNSTDPAYIPTKVRWPMLVPPDIAKVTAGTDSTYAITSGPKSSPLTPPADGRVYSWGSNDFGQLGISDGINEPIETPDGKPYRTSPQWVSTLQNHRVIDIDAGDFHVLALTGTPPLPTTSRLLSLQTKAACSLGAKTPRANCAPATFRSATCP